MKLGDIVFVHRPPSRLPKTIIMKRSAKIVEIGTDRIGLEFDFLIEGGHDCNNNGRSGYCWYVGHGCVQVMQPLASF